jgi:hypothetical protein
MTESAEERSKRVFLRYLNDYVWTTQLSVFYRDYGESLDAIDHSAVVRKNLPRLFPRSPFLFRLCLNPRVTLEEAEEYGIPDNEPNTMPYMTFFTEGIEFNKNHLADKVSKWIDADVYIYRRPLSENRIEAYSRVVARDNPHNLNRFFEKDKINRFSRLNRTRYTSL